MMFVFCLRLPRMVATLGIIAMLVIVGLSIFDRRPLECRDGHAQTDACLQARAALAEAAR